MWMAQAFIRITTPFPQLFCPYGRRSATFMNKNSGEKLSTTRNLREMLYGIGENGEEG
jgi:hypothetical protein